VAEVPRTRGATTKTRAPTTTTGNARAESPCNRRESTWACPKFLRQTFVKWAAGPIPKSLWARAFYERHKAKGASHNAPIRALAFKWIRVLYRCWIDRVPYDESRYLAALQKRHSPILKFAAGTS
jgi:hypothetical protein